MTQVANIRVNASAPFPAKIKGGGPVTIAKQNGIWTVGLTIANLGQVPVGVAPAALQLLVWNTTQQTFQNMTVSALAASGITPTKITAANSPYMPLPTDVFLYCDTSGGAIEIDLDLAANRQGAALTIKDTTGHAAANNITVKPRAGETLDGYSNAAPLVLNANYAGVRISPNTASYVIDP